MLGTSNIFQQSKLPFGDETQEQLLQNVTCPEAKGASGPAVRQSTITWRKERLATELLANQLLRHILSKNYLTVQAVTLSAQTSWFFFYLWLLGKLCWIFCTCVLSPFIKTSRILKNQLVFSTGWSYIYIPMLSFYCYKPSKSQINNLPSNSGRTSLEVEWCSDHTQDTGHSSKFLSCS